MKVEKHYQNFDHPTLIITAQNADDEHFLTEILGTALSRDEAQGAAVANVRHVSNAYGGTYVLIEKK